MCSIFSPMQIMQCSVDSIHKGHQSTIADSGAIEDVSEGTDAVKDLMLSGKAGLTCMHVYSNH